MKTKKLILAVIKAQTLIKPMTVRKLTILSNLKKRMVLKIVRVLKTKTKVKMLTVLKTARIQKTKTTVKMLTVLKTARI